MTTPTDLLPRDVTDRLLRESLRHPAHLRSFLRQAVPELADGFDCERAKLLERAFQTEDWRERESDLPFEIPYRTGDDEIWALVCVLVEHQSDTDPLMPLRLLTFAALYWDRQWREWQGLAVPRPPLRLRPVLPIVFYTGPTAWGSNRRLADLLGEPEVFHAFAPRLKPVFWNLAEQDADALLATGEEWLQLLAILRSVRDDRKRFESVFQQALLHLKSLADRDSPRWQELLRMALTLALFRRQKEEHPELQKLALETQPIRARKKEIGNMGQTMAEALFEEGWIKGQVEARRKTLRLLLAKKFGKVPKATVKQIDAITDTDRLDSLCLGVLDLAKLQDFKL